MSLWLGFQATRVAGSFQVGRKDDRARVSQELRGHAGPGRRTAEDRGLGGRLRRLRRGRARVRLGRLQGPRRPRQDPDHAGRRPTGPGSQRSIQARPGHVQRPGDDVLRPLDLQVRDRRQAGGRGRYPRSRGRPGGLPVLGGPGKLEPRELRYRDIGLRRPGAGRAGQGLDRFADRQGTLSIGGPGSCGTQVVGRPPRLPAGRPERDGPFRDRGERSPGAIA